MPDPHEAASALNAAFQTAPDLGELIAIDEDTWVALMPSGGEVMVTWVAARESLLCSASVGTPRRGQELLATQMALDHNGSAPGERCQWMARMPEGGDLLLICELDARRWAPEALAHHLLAFEADRVMWELALRDLGSRDTPTPAATPDLAPHVLRA